MPDLAVEPSAPRAAGLDREAFTAVYRSEFPWALNTLRRLGVPTSDLQDVAQRMFTAVWRQRETWDPSRPLRPWLFGFAYRTVRDHQRTAWRRRVVLDDPDAPGEGPSSDELLDASRNRRLVLDALDALDLDRRAVFVMVDIDEATAPTAAATLGIPLGTVYSRLRLAREDFAAAVKRLRLQRGER